MVQLDLRIPARALFLALLVGSTEAFGWQTTPFICRGPAALPASCPQAPRASAGGLRGLSSAATRKKLTRAEKVRPRRSRVCSGIARAFALIFPHCSRPDRGSRGAEKASWRRQRQWSEGGHVAPYSGACLINPSRSDIGAWHKELVLLRTVSQRHAGSAAGRLCATRSIKEREPRRVPAQVNTEHKGLRLVHSDPPVFEIDGFFSPEDCKAFIQLGPAGEDAGTSYRVRSSARPWPAHSTAQHSTAQHSTAQHSTAQHSAAQRSAVQHQGAQARAVSNGGGAARPRWTRRRSVGGRRRGGARAPPGSSTTARAPPLEPFHDPAKALTRARAPRRRHREARGGGARAAAQHRARAGAAPGARAPGVTCVRVMKLH
jgi:hypothetical protein